LTDVTSANTGERRPAELDRDSVIAALQARERFLTSVLGSLESFFTVDSRWRCTFANEAGGDLTGVSAETLLGADLRDYVPAEVRDEVCAQLDVAMAQRVSVTVDPLDVDQRAYTAYPLADGGLAIYVRDVSAALVRSESERRRAEGALREHEERFRSLFASMTEGVALHQLVYEAGAAVDYVVLDVNPAFERQTAVTAASVLGRRASEAYGTGEAPYLAEYARVAESGEPTSFETYFEPMRRRFRITAVGLEGKRFATIFDDITERKQAEEALRASEERYRLLHESMSQGVVYQDADGTIVSMNPAAERIIGKGPQDFLGSSSIAVERDTLREDGTAFPGLEHPAMVALRTGTQVPEVLMQVYNPREAQYRLISIQAVPLFRPGEERPSQVYTVFDDVTERRAAEEALRRSEERFRLVLGATPVTVAAQDRDLRYVWAFNQRTAPPGGVIGKTDADIFTPQEADHLRAIKQRVLDEGVELREQLWLDRPQGRMFLDCTFTPLRDEGETVVGVGVSTVDLTQVKLAEEALRRHAEMLDLSHDAIIVWRPGGTIESWNRGAEELYGFSQAEALGRVSHDLLSTIHQRPSQLIEATLHEHGSWEGEVRHHAKGGREIVVLSRLQLIRGGDGVERVLETNRDISEQKQAEEALRLSEQRLLEAQRVAHVGSWEWDIETGALSWSHELYEIYGLDPDTFTPTMESFSGFIHPDDRGLVDGAVGQILSGGGRTDFEFRIIAANGSVHELHTVGEVTATAEDGAPRVMVGVNEDVTERRHAERALRESEARQRRFYESGLVGVTYWNAEGGILDANDRFLDMVGHTREELEAGELDWFEMTPVEFARLDEHSLAELKADGVNSAPIEKEYLRKDGARVPVIVAGAMLDDERQEGVAFVLDITDRKRAEEALRESEAERVAQQERTRLARDLHDSVTQALFAATLKAEALILADEPLPDGVSQAAEEVRRLNRGALAEMRTLLLELRGVPLEDVPIGQLLRHLVEAAEGRSSVNVQLTVHSDVQPPPALHAPIYRITQEALNNSTRHAKASTTWVDLDVAPGSVLLVVGDDGCGFDPSAPDATQMGLKSMRERAAEAGARFDLVTQLGNGTVITVEWRTDQPGAGRRGA